MSGVTEVGFVFQCALCGSYSIFAIDALDHDEVVRRAASDKKTLQKDLHAVEQELLERMQHRLAPRASSSKATAETPQTGDTFGSCRRFVLLPCAACVEISAGKTYAEWLDDKENLKSPAPLCPHATVIFEAGELPPAFAHRSGKWLLAQGVGPKDLEVKLPHRLPAGQFRELLPPSAPPLRPPCWRDGGGKSGRGKGCSDADEEPVEIWEERRALLDTIVELVDVEWASPSDSHADQAASKTKRKASAKASTKASAKATSNGGSGRAQVDVLPLDNPPVGVDCPDWLRELCDAAEEVWQERTESAGSRKAKRAASAAAAAAAGGFYLKVPLLSVPAALQPVAEARLQFLSN